MHLYIIICIIISLNGAILHSIGIDNCITCTLTIQALQNNNCLGVFIIAVNMEMLCFCIQSTPGSSVVDIGGVSVKSLCAAPHPQRQQHCKDSKYINNYIPTIVLHVYFSNDVARLQRSDVSESDDC